MSVPVARVLGGVAIALAMVAPLVPLAIWSVAQGWRFPDLLPQVLSLRAWEYALSPGSGVLTSLWVSTAIALATALVATLVGVPAGRALGLYRFRGKGLVLFLVFAPALLPAIAVVPGLHGLFLRLGLAGTVPGVVLAHLVPVVPYMVLTMAATFARFDPVVEHQARSLGARPAQVFLHVTLPLILPGVMTGALFAFLVSWAQYLPTLVVGGGQVQTLPLTLYAYAAAGRNDLAGAIAILYILPGFLAVAVTARFVTGQHPALPRPGS